jgi:hypothetical protein
LLLYFAPSNRNLQNILLTACIDCVQNLILSGNCLRMRQKGNPTLPSIVGFLYLQSAEASSGMTTWNEPKAQTRTTSKYRVLRIGSALFRWKGKIYGTGLRLRCLKIPTRSLQYSYFKDSTQSQWYSVTSMPRLCLSEHTQAVLNSRSTSQIQLAAKE